MLDDNEAEGFRALVLFLCWAIVGVIVGFWLFPAWDVFRFLLIGLSPFILAGIVLLTGRIYIRLTGKKNKPD